MTLKDLSSDWRVFNIDSGAAAYSSMISAMTGGAASTELFTKGDTVVAGPDLYLIAYRPHQEVPNYSAMTAGKRPAPSTLSANTQLDLALINLHTTGTLNDIHAFNLTDEIATSEKAAKAISSIYSNFQDGSSSAADQSVENLRQLSLGLLQYLEDNDEHYPDMTSMAPVKKAVTKYVQSQGDIFVEPDTKKPYGINPWVSKRSLAAIDSPADFVVFYETKPGADGKRAVAYADGHVKRLTASEWANAKTKSHIK
jgi:prepilin-type processing-associated H-X9-DG protein